MDADTGWKIGQAVTTLIAIILAWLLAPVRFIVGRAVKNLDDACVRIDKLEKTCITREELKETIREWRDDRQRMHQDTKEILLRLESKVDTNEERAAKTRHDIRDSVNSVVTRVAVLWHDSGRSPPGGARVGGD